MLRACADAKSVATLLMADFRASTILTRPTLLAWTLCVNENDTHYRTQSLAVTEQPQLGKFLTVRLWPDWDSQLGRFKEVAFVDALHNARSTISITRRGDEIRLLTKTLFYFTPRRKLYPL